MSTEVKEDIMSVNIFFSRDSEYDEFEAVCKGYRCDVYVSVDDKMYHLNIYTPQRLCQDFETETAECGFYASESNLVLAESADRECIIKTILFQHSQKYFEEIKPLDSFDMKKLVRIR